jgi:CHAD domain-containing protein
VRLAEALDFSRTQTSELQAFEDADGDTCVIVVAGPSAALDAAQAQGQSDLWYQTFKQELVFAAAQPASEVVMAQERDDMGKHPRRGAKRATPVTTRATPATARTATARAATPTAPPAPAAPTIIEIPPMAADDPMSEAGRKVIYLHFTRMLANEAGTRLGEDPEALHDMRVATRRMRAAFALFGPHFDEKVLKQFGKGLRRAGRTLGAVRDLDVLLDKARAHVASLPPESAGSLDPLLAHWETARDVARRQMLDTLDGSAYREFVADFGAFLTTPGAGARSIAEDEPVPFQVRHVAPSLIITHYESVRAFERLLPGAPLLTYHALRIDCKGLRYALEFFRDLLGDEAPALIKQVTGMQDLLGELQDAHVAETLLDGFLRDHRKAARKRPAELSLAGVEAYREVQLARQAELVAAFPAPWAEVVGPDFRRKLALAVAAI